MSCSSWLRMRDGRVLYEQPKEFADLGLTACSGSSWLVLEAVELQHRGHSTLGCRNLKVEVMDGTCCILSPPSGA
eukprot:CAMPEP_0184313898 /NCGR_PEP_ID=MMETSP1049-20130417/68883_1 /TAXON_ID=77928 /ORGANISM="Proteomonas sulcata, Strain CCMP704" /LENGTH=74 /DNA_ID=CAMNT_0026631495 /DNA_START=16 /DNA_END=237 /DNA_ORIENTATION=+